MIMRMLCVTTSLISLVLLCLRSVLRSMIHTPSCDGLEAFYDNPNAVRDYFVDIGRMVLAAEGRKANDSHADCYQYFCVPEYGTANGRLFFFSSRRRHTRSYGDWSSDVCSSDLPRCMTPSCARYWTGDGPSGCTAIPRARSASANGPAPLRTSALSSRDSATCTASEIGRASCRERGEGSGGRATEKTTRARGTRD